MNGYMDQNKVKKYSPLRYMYEAFPYETFDHTKTLGSRSSSYLSVKRPYPDETKWPMYPIHSNVNEWAGYSQIFHMDDPVLGPLPWHQTDWIHAGGADSFFQQKWKPSRKLRPPFHVLHLGPAGKNWCGRTTTYVGGKLPPLTLERERKLHEIFVRRRGKTGESRFQHERIIHPGNP